jgi:hypothetical protein
MAFLPHSDLTHPTLKLIGLDLVGRWHDASLELGLDKVGEPLLLIITSCLFQSLILSLYYGA